MNQIVRRLVYFFIGVVPAFLVTVVILVVFPISIPAAAGTMGLAIASFRRFPLSARSYGRMALLLTCGLIVAIPLGALASLPVLLEGVRAPAAASAAQMALVLWAFFGPVACAVHALRYGRSAAGDSIRADQRGSSASNESMTGCLPTQRAKSAYD